MDERIAASVVLLQQMNQALLMPVLQELVTAVGRVNEAVKRCEKIAAELAALAEEKA